MDNRQRLANAIANMSELEVDQIVDAVRYRAGGDDLSECFSDAVRAMQAQGLLSDIAL